MIYCGGHQRCDGELQGSQIPVRTNLQQIFKTAHSSSYAQALGANVGAALDFDRHS
ncbi:hypothetical protein FIBSPDRAFT_877942 [Athelia psychrophila]|uniref:Uncharacterized protein n=1 Tax=Athelia psychrophila TaxID=1759441 RepID=A0A167VI67_9AGAM|nr:hypothetical protein FIBSPDRAFT_877942 [Fibularhizoctonia sp. CBS 109695]